MRNADKILERPLEYSANEILATSYAWLIMLSMLIGYFLEFIIRINGASYIFFLFGISVLSLLILLEEKIRIKGTFQTYVTVTSFVLLIVSIPFWSGFQNISAYFAIPIAYSIYVYAFPQFKKLILVVLCVSLVVAFYETVTQELLFVPIRKGTDIAIENDYSYIFRAKGLTPGPLTLGQLSILSVLLFPKKWWVILVGLACSMLASSRSGVILILALFLIRMGTHINIKKIAVIAIVAGLLIIVGTGTLIDPRTLERLTNVLNFDQADPGIDESNITRVYYWLAALSHFSDYSVIHKIFGDNGSFFIKEENNPESGWLSLLVDNGVLGVCFYLIVFAILFIKCIRFRRWVNLFESLFLFVGMMPFTLNLSREGSLLFWLSIFTLAENAQERETESDRELLSACPE